MSEAARNAGVQALKNGDLDGFLLWSPTIDKAVTDGQPVWIGAFSDAFRSQMLSYSSGDGSCRLSTLADGDSLRWTRAATFEA